MKASVKEFCRAGMFAAVIFILTAYVHIPSHTGYTHIGDAFVYLAGCFLSPVYAIAAGVGGAVLADVVSGYAIWVPATAIIKGLTAACFSARGERILTRRNKWALVWADLLCIFGYYLYEALICGSFVSPLLGAWGYVIQCAGSNLLFLLVALAIDGHKKRASK